MARNQPTRFPMVAGHGHGIGRRENGTDAHRYTIAVLEASTESVGALGRFSEDNLGGALSFSPLAAPPSKIYLIEIRAM